MGAAIAQRLHERGCEVVGWDRNGKACDALGKRGLRVADGPRAVILQQVSWGVAIRMAVLERAILE